MTFADGQIRCTAPSRSIYHSPSIINWPDIHYRSLVLKETAQALLIGLISIIALLFLKRAMGCSLEVPRSNKSIDDIAYDSSTKAPSYF